jgi:peptidoglycan/xylan/chitin deacetylase (PgdA/CDA1 family)
MRKLGLMMGVLLMVLVSVFAKQRAVPASGGAELPAENKYVALTFDDGPRRDTTGRLLDGLLQRGASATFFVVGEQIEANRDLVERMRTEGHQVGNHTWSHVRLQGADSQRALQEVQQTEEALEALLGGSGYWLRPPYGFIDGSEQVQITVPMVKWSVDPRDWESRNTGQVTQAVLLHDIYDTSVDAALAVVDALEEEGYLFVTVEELLALNGVEPQPGVLYRTGSP